MANCLYKRIFALLLTALIALSICGCTSGNTYSASVQQALDAFDTWSDPYMVIDGNVPAFTEKDKQADCFEYYSDMDAYNRCGYAFACVCANTLPTQERGSIGQVKPTGWQTVKYDIVDGKYLYNRCHLIGYQLSGENANPYNLITGTRYFNTQGMLPFEDRVAEYVKTTGNRVLYRVTPVFVGNEMVARGVHMEAFSVEDNGQGICFSVFVYNRQPGIVIDYTTGESRLAEPVDTNGQDTYVLNTNTMKFHLEDCIHVADIKDKNRQSYTGSRDELIAQGYSPCGGCKP